MKENFKIGTNTQNDIVLNDPNCADFHAEIQKIRGKWIITKQQENLKSYINNRELETQHELKKYDVIQIGSKRIFWSNYLIESSNQELYIRDFTTLNGRINRSNYRALLILILGLIPTIYFAPGLLLLTKRRQRLTHNEQIELVQAVAPTIYFFGFSLLVLFFILISIKRMRDTGNSLNKLLIPGYNLKLLLFSQSKN